MSAIAFAASLGGLVADATSSTEESTSFGTFAGTFLVLLLIAATVVIFRLMSGSLRRMRANVEEHPEHFGNPDTAASAATEPAADGAPQQ